MEEEKNTNNQNTEDKKEKFKKFNDNSSQRRWLWGSVTLFISATLIIWGWSLRTRFYDFNEEISQSELTELQQDSNLTEQLKRFKERLQINQTTSAKTTNTKKKEFASELSEVISTSTSETNTETSTQATTTTNKQNTSSNQTTSN